MAAMTEPRTEAGKRLVAWAESDARPLAEFGWHEVIEAVLAIEEAAHRDGLDTVSTWTAFLAYNDEATRKGSGFTGQQVIGARAMLLWLAARPAAPSAPPTDFHADLTEAITAFEAETATSRGYRGFRVPIEPAAPSAPLRLMLDGSPCWCVSDEAPHAGWFHAPVCIGLRNRARAEAST